MSSGGNPQGMAALRVQQQIRENNFEMQDYLRDLRGWQEEIKAKDDTAKQRGKEEANARRKEAGERMTQRYRQSQGQAQPARRAEGQASLPPVRGRAEGAALAVTAAADAPAVPPVRGSTATKAGHTYDYYKDWDSFDADGAMREADKAGSGQAAPPANMGAIAGAQRTDAALAAARAARARRQTDPLALKNAGNEAFKRGEWEDAAKFYSRSLEASPTAVAYANRAMARIKMEQWAQAEQDCTDAIALDDTYIKAWSRRGSCRRALGRHREAAEDFEYAVRLMPANKENIAERKRSVEDVIRELKVPMPTEWTDVEVACEEEEEGGKPAEARTVDSSGGVDAALPGETGALEGSGSGVGSSLEGLFGSTDSADDGGFGALMGSAPAVSGGSEDVAARVAAAGASVMDAVTALDEGKDVAASASSPARGAGEQQIAAAAARLALSSLPPPPKSSYEFESAWKQLGGDTTAQAAYLEALDAKQLPKVFKASLEQKLLRSVLQVTAAELAPAAAMELLEGLAGVPRFSMAAMFLSAADKAGLAPMWDAACADAALAERVAKLRKLYRC